MADFNIDLEFDIVGLKNIDDAIAKLHALGVNVKKITKEQEKVGAVTKNIGKFQVSANENVRKSVEALVKSYKKSAEIQQKSQATSNPTKDAAKKAKEELQERERLRKLEWANYAEKARKFNLEENFNKARDAYFAKKEREDARRSKKEMDDRERALKFEQKVRNAIRKSEEKDERDRERALNDEIKTRLRLARIQEREAQKRHREEERNRFSIGRTLRDVRALRTDMGTIRNLATLGGGLFVAFQAFRGASNMIGDAVRQSVQFNEELLRSKIILQGLGVSDLNKSIFQIEASGSKQEQTMLKVAGQNAEELARMIRAEAVKAGQTPTEAMAAVQTFLPNVLGAFGGTKNAMRDRFEEVKFITTEFLRLSSVMKMMDSSGRQLKFHAGALEEVFSASLSGKGSGADAFKSLRTRENAPLRKEEMEAVVKALRAGDPVSVILELEKALARFGITSGKVDDLLRKMLGPNLAAVGTHFQSILGIFGENSYTRVAKFFAQLNRYMGDLTQNKKFQAAVKELGDRFGLFIQDKLNWLQSKIVWLNGPDGRQFLKSMITNIENFSSGVFAAMQAVGSFFGALLGFNDNTNEQKQGMQDWTTTVKLFRVAMENAQGPAAELGKTIREILNDVINVYDKIREVKKFAQNPLGYTGDALQHAQVPEHVQFMANPGYYVGKKALNMAFPQTPQATQSAPIAKPAKPDFSKLLPATPSIVVQQMTVQANNPKELGEALGKNAQKKQVEYNPFANL